MQQFKPVTITIMKINRMKPVILSLALFAYAAFATAQTNNADTLKSQLVKDWQRAKEYTLAFINAMPADKYNWLPGKDIRNFSAQMLHHTYLTIGFVSNGTGQKRVLLGNEIIKPLEEIVPHQKDSVVSYVMAGYDFAIEGIKNMNTSSLFERGKRNELKLTWINKAFEHQTQHRGQCVLYLRLLGLKAPEELLF
jgi:uncharacterized damage-inducible protein DinB